MFCYEGRIRLSCLGTILLEEELSDPNPAGMRHTTLMLLRERKKQDTRGEEIARTNMKD